MKQNKVEIDKTILKNMLHNSSALLSRAQFARTAGIQYKGNRDLYDTLGYKHDIVFEDYRTRYDRQDIARAIISKPPATTWRRNPIITEPGKPDSSWVKEWDMMEKRLKIYRSMQRADRLSGIGEFGVIFLGFRDGLKTQLIEPALKMSGPKDLLYLSVFDQGSVDIRNYVSDTTNPRFGLPETYTLNMVTPSGDSRSHVVHWSRIIHIAEGVDDTETIGTPRLLPVFNRLFDVEKIVGGSSESYWRLAQKAMHINVDSGEDGATIVVDQESLEDEAEKFIHDYKNWMFTENTTVKMLDVTPADPEKAFKVVIQLISAVIDMPFRILIGSERGELASNTDQETWFGRIRERQIQYAEPEILRAFIDRLMMLTVLSPAEYEVKWPDLFEVDDKTKAEVAKNYAQALKFVTEALLLGENVISMPEIRELVFGLKEAFEGSDDLDEFMVREAEGMVEQLNRILKKNKDAA